MLEEINCFCCDRGSSAGYPGHDFSAGTVHFDGLLFASRTRQRLRLSGLNGHGQGWWSFPWLEGKTVSSLLVLANGETSPRQTGIMRACLYSDKDQILGGPIREKKVSTLSFQDDYARSSRMEPDRAFLLGGDWIWLTERRHGLASLLQWT